MSNDDFSEMSGAMSHRVHIVNGAQNEQQGTTVTSLPFTTIHTLPTTPSLPITIIRMGPSETRSGAGQRSELLASMKLKLVRPNGAKGPIQVSQVVGGEGSSSPSLPQSLSSRLPDNVQSLPTDRRKDNLGRYSSSQPSPMDEEMEELEAGKQMVKFKNRMVTLDERNRCIAARKRREREKRKLREARARQRLGLMSGVYDSVLHPDRCRFAVPPKEENMSVCWQQVIRHHVLAPINPIPLTNPSLPPSTSKTPLLGSKDAVLTWTVDDVVRWSRGLKFLPSQPSFARKIMDESIDGEALLSLTQEDFQSRFALKMGPSLKLINIVRSILHSSCPIRHYSYGKTPKPHSTSPQSDKEDADDQ